MIRPAALIAALALATALPAAASPTVEAGMDNNFVLTASGQVWGWGGNTGGKPGNGATANSTVPVRAGTRVGAYTGGIEQRGGVGFGGMGSAWLAGDGPG